MRQDLIKHIEAHEEVTNAIVLTHNIDFVFLQMMVVPALRRCGRPSLTVFADAQCASATFAYQSPVLSTLGLRYRVVPILMNPGFRFHPKAVLLSGPAKGSLFVGSGNLTFGGWRENAEIWVRFETDRDTTAPFSAFQSYLREVVARVPLAGPVKDEIDEAFDGRTRPWAREMDPPSGILGRVGQGPTLLERIASVAGTERVGRLVVCSPYYDSEGLALGELVGRLKPATTEVLVQKKYPGLPRTAAAGLAAGVKITPVRFTRTGDRGLERESFLHAKFYGITTASRTLAVAGSANCSRAALTIPGGNGNAELLAVQELAPEEFDGLYLSELPRADGDLELGESVKEEAQPPPAPLRVLAARYDNRQLWVAYSCLPGVTVTRCLAGDVAGEFNAQSSGLGWAEFAYPPTRITMEGLLDGGVVRSAESWVDVESELRHTARGRSFAGTVRANVQGDRWGIGGWKEVLDVFCKHLQYLPTRAPITGGPGRGHAAKNVAEFTAEDVFSTEYGLPNLVSAAGTKIGDNRVHGLQQILLRWFGIPDHDEDKEDDGTAGNGDDGSGDRPVTLPEIRRRNCKKERVAEEDKRRANRSLEQMTSAMCSEEFLALRSPELLAADLKIAAVLLRTGLKERWIGGAEFFETTRQIWSSLFFSSPGRSNQGWLERRYREAEDPDAFALRMASPELSAALAAWSASTPAGSGTPDGARLALAQVLAVARLPWLWRGGKKELIARELGRMLASTDDAPSAADEQEMQLFWVKLIRRGEALRALESALEGQSPAGIRERITGDQISRGELLWQGTSGYCVVLDHCRRSQEKFVPVLKLQGREGEGLFKPAFLIPMRKLLTGDILPNTERFGIAQRDTIRGMLNEISRLFAGK